MVSTVKDEQRGGMGLHSKQTEGVLFHRVYQTKFRFITKVRYGVNYKNNPSIHLWLLSMKVLRDCIFTKEISFIPLENHHHFNCTN